MASTNSDKDQKEIKYIDTFKEKKAASKAAQVLGVILVIGGLFECVRSPFSDQASYKAGFWLFFIGLLIGIVGRIANWIYSD